MFSSYFPIYDASSLVTSRNRRDLLGRGSFASVRKCKHIKLGEVVVKCFSIEGSSEKHDEATEGIKREVEVLSRLCHKNIVQIFGVTRWTNCIGIVMSYIDGGNLEDFLMSTKNIKEIPWILRLKFAEEVADGLKYLHHHDPKKAFVHGDLKPQNILLTSDLVLKIADFGSVSICLATGATLGSLNVPLNTQHTLCYTAPEFLKHPSNKRKPSMDVYSLSMIIYEIITRHRAYDGVNPGLLLQVIKDVGQKPDEKYIRDVQLSLKNKSHDLSIFELLEKLMKECWNYKPENRLDIQEVHQKVNLEFEKLKKTKLQHQLEAVQILQSTEKQKKFHTVTMTEKLSSFLPPFEEIYQNDSLRVDNPLRYQQSQLDKMRHTKPTAKQDTLAVLSLERLTWHQLLQSDIQLFSKSDNRCVLVQNTPEHTTNSELQTYFENTHQSGGGSIEKVCCLIDGVLIVFREPHAAKRVVEFMEHRINGVKLRVFLKYVPAIYTDRFMIEGKFQNVSMLYQLLECCDDETSFSVSPIDDGNRYLVSAQKSLDVDCMLKELEKITLDDIEMKTSKLCGTDCIKVLNLEEKVTNNTIKLTFMNKKQTSGGHVTAVERDTKQHVAYVYFANYQDAQRVLERSKTKEILLGGKSVDISLKHHVTYWRKNDDDAQSQRQNVQQFEYTPDVDYDIMEFVKRSFTHLENLKRNFEPIAEVDLIQTTSDDNRERHLFVARFNPQPTQYDQSHFEAECVRLINNFFSKFASRKGHIDATRLQEICDANSWSEENNLVEVKVDSNAGRLVLLGWNHSEPGSMKVVGAEDDVMSVWKWLQKHCDVIEIKEKLLTSDIQYLMDNRILPRLQTKFQDIVNVSIENDEIILKGMRCEVDSCRVKLWKELKSLHSSTLSFLDEIKQRFVTEALTSRIQTDVNVAEALATALHQANIRGVLQPDSKPLFKYYHESDLKHAMVILNKEITSSYIVVEINLEELLKSEEWKELELELWSSNALLAYRNKKNSCITLVGLTSLIPEGKQRVRAHAQSYATVRKVITLPYPVASFLSNFPNEVELDIHFKDVEWNITAKGTCGIVIKGKHRLVESAIEWISKKKKSLICETHTLQVPGMSTYFNDEIGKQFLKTTQTINKCIILIDTDQCPQLKVTNHLTESPTPKSLLTVRLPNTDVSINVHEMDITDISSDAIVNASNKQLELRSGGLSKRISLKGGPSIQQEMSAHIRRLGGELSPGFAVATTSGDLPFKKIIHVVGPTWSSSKEVWASRCLRNCILAALHEADKHELKSIAIPAVSCGIFGGKAKVCVKLIVHAIVEYFRSNVSRIKQVDLVEMVNPKITECFKMELAKVVISKGDLERAIAVNSSKDFRKSWMDTIRSVTTSSLPTSRIGSLFGVNGPFNPVFVRVKHGDLRESNCDVVVNLVGANFNLKGGGQLCSHLIRKAGKSIIEEFNSNPLYQSSYYRVTSGGQLPCKYVVHVITPIDVNAIVSLLEHVFELVDEKMECNSLALPAIGTGRVGLKWNEVAQSIRFAVDNFAKKHPQHLRRIDVVLFVEKMMNVFESTLSPGATAMQGNHQICEEKPFVENAGAIKQQRSIIPEEINEDKFMKLFFCSSNQMNINNALQRIRKRVHDVSVTKVIESRAIACLGLTEETELMDLETKHNVVVLKSLGELGLGQLSISGLKSSVADAYSVASKIILEFEEILECSRQVVWKVDDEMRSFNFRENWQLEKAYRRNKLGTINLKIKLHSKSVTFRANFFEMKGTFLETGMVLNILRLTTDNSD